MNVLDQKKEMCLSFDTPPSETTMNKRIQKVGDRLIEKMMFFLLGRPKLE